MGFSDKGVREREPFMQHELDILMRKLGEKLERGKIDVTWWLDCIGFDTMAHIAFGRSFGAL